VRAITVDAPESGTLVVVQPDIAESMRGQARTCEEMGSPIYAALLEHSADDVEGGGPIAALLDDWEGHSVLDIDSLRWMGALHYLALGGQAPDLAEQFPSTGGRFRPDQAFEIARRLAREQADLLRPLLQEGVQTNEVRRCCALYPGALRFAAMSRHPLRLLEIGSSAGLNLCMDRYRYLLGDTPRGDPDSGLLLSCEWRGEPPPDGRLHVVSRRGCDLDPFDLTRDTQRLRLQSFVWPDQAERRERLARALAIVSPDPPEVTRARAGEWLEPRLGASEPGQATLLFHSVMWWYVPEAERTHITEVVEAAGRAASDETPLGWLRMESTGPDACELRLRSWPGNAERRLARVHHHGAWIEWNEEAES